MTQAGDKPRLLPRLLGPITIRDQPVLAPRHVSPSVALNEAALHRRVLERVAPPSILVDDTHRGDPPVRKCGPIYDAFGGIAERRCGRPCEARIAIRAAIGPPPLFRAATAYVELADHGALQWRAASGSHSGRGNKRANRNASSLGYVH
jgi:hypothetical protein